uniref:RRM domain-containing protein n=1 Tax=Haemonchus contortus TaxID=6289 RepID=A0A7I5E8M9_HAECO
MKPFAHEIVKNLPGSTCSGDVDAKRQSAVIAVKRFKLSDTDALVEHMGQFGEIMNIEVIKGKDPKVPLTFRNREDADEAIVDGGLFKGTMLDVTWHWRSDGSRENSPLSADKMLASIPQSEVRHWKVL